MYEHEIINYLNDNIIGTTNDFYRIMNLDTDLGADSRKKIVKADICRLYKGKKIYKMQDDVYCIIRDTKWGKMHPSNEEIIERYFIQKKEGYYTGATYLNQIGLTPLVPVKKEVVVNDCGGYKNFSFVDIIKPKTKITRKNKNYLEILDGIDAACKYGCDIHGNKVIPNIIKSKGIDIDYLIYLSKTYYTKENQNTVLRLLKRGVSKDYGEVTL